jgi:GDP-L-fucose synthase
MERILVTGGTGLIGRNLVARLRDDGHDVTAVGSEHDLRDATVARKLFGSVEPDLVYHLAARVGGIYANTTQKPGFYRDNVLINTNVVDATVDAGVEYLFAMGTGCAYPKRLEGQVLNEDDYLDGLPEPTNDAYAYAKRGMLVHLDALRELGALDFCFCLPANIYGPHDNFHPMHAHVVPAVVRRFVEARNGGAETVEVWGDGTSRRDFLYIDDCIDAIVRLTDVRFSGPVNVATGKQTTVRELAEAIARASGFDGEIVYDPSMPAGQPGRTFDVTRLRAAINWTPEVDLDEGLKRTVAWFEANADSVRER